MKDKLNIPFSKIFDLIRNPFFIKLTIVGNSIIFLFSLIFHAVEAEANPKLISHLDAIWWSFATATTTGYGDITPVTTAGKILGIILMLIGTGLFATYTAFFADFFLGKSEMQLDKKIHDWNKKMDKLSSDKSDV